MCLTKHHAVKMYGGLEVSIQVLTSILSEGESSASCSGCLRPRGKSSGTQWIGGWVDSRAGFLAMAKRKKLSNPVVNRNRGSPASGLVTILVELSQLPL